MDKNVNTTFNYMDDIIEYLVECCKINEDKRDILKDESRDQSNKINEIRITLDSMDKKDNSYNLFSPNKKEIKYNGKTMEEMNSDIDNLNTKNLELNECIDTIDMKILNIRKIVEVLRDFKCEKDEKNEQNNEFDNIDIFNKESEGIKILETQELERKRIARELHDSVIQNLTNIVHKTELSLKFVDIDPIRTKLELKTMIDTVRTTINDMRAIIYDLRPMSLDDLGLIISIERHISQIKLNNNIKINFNVTNEEIKLLPIFNLTLFRIIQEACNNIIKHANAKTINIKLIYNIDNIELFVIDDGIGFNLNEEDNIYSESNSFGLSMMKERIYLLNGSIKIKSEEGTGTTIYVQVPI